MWACFFVVLRCVPIGRTSEWSFELVSDSSVVVPFFNVGHFRLVAFSALCVAV